MEKYRSGYNGPDSKSGCPEMGTWVRIPPSPLIMIYRKKWIADAVDFFWIILNNEDIHKHGGYNVRTLLCR